MKISLRIVEERFFFTVFAINALLYGLVYLFPYNEYYEPFIPSYFKLLTDVLFVIILLFFSIKQKLNQPQVYYLIFLGYILFIGLLHIEHTSVNDYLHFTFRNIFFYGLFFYSNSFTKISLKKFHYFHENLFKSILLFGLILFLLKKLNIPNPVGFKDWMWEKNRLISTWLNPNSLGFYMMFYLPYFYFKKKAITPIIGLICLTIFLTGSITAIIGLIMFVIYVSSSFLLKRRINIKYIILFFMLAPIFLYFSIYYGVFEYLWFKIDVLFIQKSKTHTSVSTRVQNIVDLYNYFSFDNILSVLFGNFNTDLYIRLDSQYLNIFYNYGLLGIFIYFIYQISLFIYFLNGKTHYSKALVFFTIWLFLIAFNLTAYLYRSNLVVFYFIMLIYIMKLEKEKNSLNCFLT